MKKCVKKQTVNHCEMEYNIGWTEEKNIYQEHTMLQINNQTTNSNNHKDSKLWRNHGKSHKLHDCAQERQTKQLIKTKIWNTHLQKEQKQIWKVLNKAENKIKTPNTIKHVMHLRCHLAQSSFPSSR
jgi:hypothetical protein